MKNIRKFLGISLIVLFALGVAVCDNDPDPVSTYSVTFNINADGVIGASEAPQALTGLTKDAAINAPDPAPTSTSHIFGGWYKEAGCTNEWDFANDIVTGAITLYAKWNEKARVTVAFNLNTAGVYGASQAPASISNLLQGSTITAPDPVPTSTSHTFDGWYKEAAGTNAWDFNDDTVTTNTTLYAQWEEKARITVTFNLNAAGVTGASQTIESMDVLQGATITAPSPAPTSSSHMFDGWYKESDGTTVWTFASDTVTEAIILFAKWTAFPDAFIDFSGYTGTAGFLGEGVTNVSTTEFYNYQGITGKGMRVSYVGHPGEGDGSPNMERIGGQWQANALRLNFYIDNPAVKNANTINMTITYYDYAANEGLQVNYKKSALGSAGDIPVPTGDPDTYVTETVQLTDCGLYNPWVFFNDDIAFRFYGRETGHVAILRVVMEVVN